MQNWAETLLSQFAASPTLTALIESFNDAMDPASDIASFQQYIWNVRTAVGNGLDIWGKIVNVERTLATASGPITLKDPDYQTLILAKAAGNIGNSTVQTMNRLLTSIFAASGPVYVQDNLDMTITYVIGFRPTDAQLAMAESADVMPRPAGVQVNVTFPSVSGPIFGFDSENSYISGFDVGSWGP